MANIDSNYSVLLANFLMESKFNEFVNLNLEA